MKTKEKKGAGTSPRRAVLPLLTTALSALILFGCSESDPAQSTDLAKHEVDRQTAFRVRSDFAAALNEDSGWANATNQPAKVMADEPFRLRFEVEAAGAASTERRYQLEVRRNGGAWEPLGAENFPQPAKEFELKFDTQPEQPLADIWQLVSGDASALSWQVEADGGHLQLQASEQPLLTLIQHQTPWAPLEFAVELRLPETESARAGVVFGYQNPENYLRVDVLAGEAIQVVQISGGREAVLVARAVEVKHNQWFELKLIMEAQALTVEYDDEALVFTENLEQSIPRSMAGIYVPEGGRVDIHTLVAEGEPRSPRASIMASAAFANSAQTQDLLKVSEQAFTGGAGISFTDTTPVWLAAESHSEWEFPIVIRRFSDEAALNEPGDRFDFRLVDADGKPLAAAAPATVTLAIADRHLGGTFVETPMRLGPWQAANGDLYFLMEPAETWNALMTVKSADGGRSWREIDGEHRPETGDLEGFASVLVDDQVHMLHQTSDHVFYHVFRTSDHPEQPDTWAIQDERLASPEEPPTQVADIALRSDGSVVAVYGGPHKIHLRTRSPDGNWSEETVIDADKEPDLSGPTIVLGRDDVVHLAYTGNDGTAWYRQLSSKGELTERVKVADGLGTDSEDIGAILPLLYLPESDTVSVIYRKADGFLWERRVNAKADLSEPLQVTNLTVIQNAVDADQTGADAIVWGDSVQVLFIEEQTGHLFHTERRGDGDWTAARRLIDDENVQWVRGALVKQSDQSTVYGYVYDGGADGGSGMNRYKELALPLP
jgi:hypothetical protein